MLTLSTTVYFCEKQRQALPLSPCLARIYSGVELTNIFLSRIYSGLELTKIFLSRIYSDLECEGLMLYHWPRRRPNDKPLFCQCVVLSTHLCYWEDESSLYPVIVSRLVHDTSSLQRWGCGMMGIYRTKTTSERQTVPTSKLGAGELIRLKQI